ncbi:MAG: hypothetical protein R3E53_08660 [Myxococcota bacterium]
MATERDDGNPFLLHGALPRFDRLEANLVNRRSSALLARSEAALARLEADLEPTWSSLVEPLERIGDRLGYAWGLVGHLMGVHNGDALPKAHAKVQGDVIGFGLRRARAAIC